MKKNCHLVSGHFEWGTSVYFLVVTCCFCWIYIRAFTQEGMITRIGSTEWWICLIGVTIFFISQVIVIIAKAYDFFGWWKTDWEKISFYAPFRFPISLERYDIEYVGIDYDHKHQFWIVLGKTMPNRKYEHKIANMPFSKECVRICFSSSAFEAIAGWLPPAKTKQLYRAKSILNQKIE